MSFTTGKTNTTVTAILAVINANAEIVAETNLVGTGPLFTKGIGEFPLVLVNPVSADQERATIGGSAAHDHRTFSFEVLCSTNNTDDDQAYQDIQDLADLLFEICKFNTFGNQFNQGPPKISGVSYALVSRGDSPFVYTASFTLDGFIRITRT